MIFEGGNMHILIWSYTTFPLVTEKKEKGVSFEYQRAIFGIIAFSMHTHKKTPHMVLGM